MKLFCSKCKKPIYHNPDNCPNCGYPTSAIVYKYNYDKIAETDEQKLRKTEGGDPDAIPIPPQRVIDENAEAEKPSGLGGAILGALFNTITRNQEDENRPDPKFFADENAASGERIIIENPEKQDNQEK